MTTAAAGRLAGALIRTFLWLSVDLPLLAGMAPARSPDGDAGFRVLATVPSTPTLWLFLFRWFHLGLTAGCDYGG